MNLLCDEMLGKLARWLRILGVDTAYLHDVSDDQILAVATAEGRMVLSRDAALIARAMRSGAGHRVVSLDPEEQLREVVAALHIPLDGARMLSRCTLCNAVLAPLSAQDAAARVPEGVRVATETFWRCPGCDKVYWRGTHVVDMEQRLQRLIRAQP